MKDIGDNTFWLLFWTLVVGGCVANNYANKKVINIHGEGNKIINMTPIDKTTIIAKGE